MNFCIEKILIQRVKEKRGWERGCVWLSVTPYRNPNLATLFHQYYVLHGISIPTNWPCRHQGFLFGKKWDFRVWYWTSSDGRICTIWIHRVSGTKWSSMELLFLSFQNGELGEGFKFWFLNSSILFLRQLKWYDPLIVGSYISFFLS